MLGLETAPCAGVRVTYDGARGGLPSDGEGYEQKRYLGSGDPRPSGDVVLRLGSIVSCDDDAAQ